MGGKIRLPENCSVQAWVYQQNDSTNIGVHFFRLNLFHLEKQKHHPRYSTMGSYNLHFREDTNIHIFEGLPKNPCIFPWITWGDPKGSYRKPLPIFTLKIGRSKILTRTVQQKSSHYLPPFFRELNLALTCSYSIPPPKKSNMASWKSD